MITPSVDYTFLIILISDPNRSRPMGSEFFTISVSRFRKLLERFIKHERSPSQHRVRFSVLSGCSAFPRLRCAGWKLFFLEFKIITKSRVFWPSAKLSGRVITHLIHRHICYFTHKSIYSSKPLDQLDHTGNFSPISFHSITFQHKLFFFK